MNKSSPKFLGFLSGKMKRVHLHFHLSILSKLQILNIVSHWSHWYRCVFLGLPCLSSGGKGWFLWMIIVCYVSLNHCWFWTLYHIGHILVLQFKFYYIVSHWSHWLENILLPKTTYKCYICYMNCTSVTFFLQTTD